MDTLILHRLVATPELDAERHLFRIFENDGDRLPGLRDLVAEQVIDAGHQRVAELIQRRHVGTEPIDAAALAVVVIGPLANHRRTRWTFGQVPLDVDDERLLRTWADALTSCIDTR
jgi:hypothetical protein